MILRLVARRVDPEDPGRSRGRDHRVDRPGAALAVAAHGVEPTHRVVDHVDAVGDRVVDGLAERYLRVDADERQGGIRCHLVHDLRDRSPMWLRGCELAVAEIHRGHGCRKLALGLTVRVPGEPEVDDRDLHARASAARTDPGRRPGSRDALAGDRLHTGLQRRTDVVDVRIFRQRPERRGRQQDLQLLAVTRLDSSTLPVRSVLGVAAVPCHHDSANPAVLDAYFPLSREADRCAVAS